jgi:hypothetical protein
MDSSGRNGTHRIVGVLGAVALAAAGYGAYTLMSGPAGGGPKARTVVAEPPSAESAAAGEKAFLAAWASGDLQTAAALTDSPDAAAPALAAFRDRTKATGLALTPTGPAPAPTPTASAAPGASAGPDTAGHQVLEGFTAQVHFAAAPTAWSYDGRLGMVKMSDGKAAVHWDPSVIHPHLTAGESITVQKTAAAPTSITDRHGKPLTAFPSLAPLLTQLRTAVPVPADAPDDGTSGSKVVIAKDSGQGKTETLFTIAEPKAGKPLRLTIDADLQRAAEQAVATQAKNGTHNASMVAVEPATGHVLAIANAPAGGFNRAFQGAIAPGSTMKIIVSAALLEAGLTPNSPVPCPSTKVVNGQTYKNDFPEPHEEFTLAQDFAISCNTAFIGQAMATLKPGALAAEASDVFGINGSPGWKTGLTNTDGRIPTPANTTNATAAQYIGQGTVTMNTLAMASVAATVQSGTFRQPILVAGLPQPAAKRTLTPEIDKALKALMNATTHGNGTAAQAMAGLSGDIGAKTGTAEVGAPTDPTNSWFTCYRNNLAVATEVEGGGFGADAAGPASATLLRIGNNG